MSRVIFVYEGVDVIIQCTKDEKMKDICQRCANKIERNIYSLIFLYAGKQLNFNLSFNEQANNMDKKRNEMKILIYKDENNEYICPKCGERIKLNIKDDILSSVKNIKDAIDGIKLNIDNILKISLDNSVNVQIKNISLIINSLNGDIKKINEKINNLLNYNKETKNENDNLIKNENMNNYIIAEVNIKEEEEVNKNIRILNSYEEHIRENPYLKIENKHKNEDEIKNCEIEINEKLIPFNYFYQFKSKGKYTIKYSFNNNINNMGYMFIECSKLTSINLSNFNTNKVTNMSNLFSGCSSLTNINLSNIKTNNVTDMDFLFSRCSSLININLSNFNTSNVNKMRHMFYGCSSLTNINLSNFNTVNVTDMSFMFNGCSSLININLSNFNTNNVTNMWGMFQECSKLSNINLSNFNTKNVSDMRSLFSGCSSLININLSKFYTNKVTNMSGMFSDCSKLTKIDLSNFSTNNVTDMCFMFQSCSSLTNINLSKFNTNNAKIDYMFSGCLKLKKENIMTNDKKLLSTV